MRIEGKYNTAEVFTDNIDDACIEQIQHLVDQPQFVNSNIRIMPDCHKGTGCVVGFTMNITDSVIPNLVGVDIGCGMIYTQVQEDIDLELLDNYINKNIPSGFNVYKESNTDISYLIDALSFKPKKIDHIKNSVGTLGGGNHFISVEKGTTGTYLIIHTGSRNLGLQVCKHHQEIAYQDCKSENSDYGYIIKSLISAGKEDLIQQTLDSLVKPKIIKELSFLKGSHMSDYLHDMQVCQEYAERNRKAILCKILENINGRFGAYSYNETVHNYIDKDGMIRKGAVDASKGKELIIPLNMRDGSLLAIGKGNTEWNNSAPHGAGRILSRTQAKNTLVFEDYRKSMEGIVSSSVCKSTIDEAPFAYKQDIEEHIGDTVEVIDHLKPIYNFKAK